MKLASIVWVLKKIRHMIEIVDFALLIIVYINHDFVFEIVKQTTFFISFIDKLNLRLIKTSNYLQRFNLNIRYKSNKQHIMSNVFFKLVNVNIENLLWKFFANDDENKLNVLFIASLIEMNEFFRKRIIVEYENDLNWKKIDVILNVENDVIFSFCRKKKRFDFSSRRFDHLRSQIENVNWWR